MFDDEGVQSGCKAPCLFWNDRVEIAAFAKRNRDEVERTCSHGLDDREALVIQHVDEYDEGQSDQGVRVLAFHPVDERNAESF